MLVTSSWAATSVKSSSSRLYSDRLQQAVSVTATTYLSGPNETQPVYTTPASGSFILTQLCVSPVSGGIRLAVDEFGGIAHLGIAGDGCHTFPEGVLLPLGSAITCSTFATASRGNHFCTISGLEN